MRSLTRTLLLLALVVVVGVVLAVWVGSGLGGGASAPAGPAATSPATGAIPAGAIPSGATPATVRYVHDGDTLYLTPEGSGTELKVRLIGIDTPEIGERAECYGEDARDRLRALLPEGTSVWILAEDGPQDRYGRSLLHVFLPDGTHVNRLLIDEGLAWAMFFDPNRDYEREFRAAEADAEAARVGMWGVCGY